MNPATYADELEQAGDLLADALKKAIRLYPNHGGGNTAMLADFQAALDAWKKAASSWKDEVAHV